MSYFIPVASVTTNGTGIRFNFNPTRLQWSQWKFFSSSPLELFAECLSFFPYFSFHYPSVIRFFCFLLPWLTKFIRFSQPKYDPICSFVTTQIDSNILAFHHPNSPIFFAFHYSNVIHFLAFHYLNLIPCLGFHFPILIPYFVFWLPEFDLIFRVFIIQVPSVLPIPQFYGWTPFQKFWHHNTYVSLSSGLFYKNVTDISNLAGSVKTEVNYPETLFVSKITFRILSSK